MKIFINPGHGGSDPGAVSKSGTKECIIAANICKILADKFKLDGYSVIVYQQKKYLTEVTNEENKSNADIFISVHCNSFSNPSSNGIETLYYPKSIKGKKLALAVQNSLVKELKLQNRGIKPRNDLHVLKHTSATAILVECAFISNPTEEKILKENPEIFANAIFNGAKQFVSS